MDDFEIDELLSNVTLDPRLERYDGILVNHPKIKQLAIAFAGLMNETRSTIKRNAARNLDGGRHAAKPDELRMLPIIGPSGSTKSKTIQVVTEKIHLLRHSEEMPVLVATLRSTTRHTRDLQAEIIASFRDPSARVIRTMHDYSEAAVNAAIMKMARKKGTVLVVLDEAHNMVKESGPEAMAQEHP